MVDELRTSKSQEFFYYNFVNGVIVIISVVTAILCPKFGTFSSRPMLVSARPKSMVKLHESVRLHSVVFN